MNNKLRTPAVEHLFEAILCLENTEECFDFFEDLCTVKEIKDMSQRLEVAVLLDKGLSYQKVSELTNVSSATISRVKRCLDYGSGGYTKAIAEMGEKK